MQGNCAYYLLPFSGEDGKEEDMETKSQEHKMNTAVGLRDSDMEAYGEEEDVSLVRSKNDLAEVRKCIELMNCFRRLF